MSFRNILIKFFLVFIYLPIFSNGKSEEKIITVDFVDLERFSGDWYVIGVIPTIFEKGATNGIETYTIDNDGNIEVKYSFKKNNKSKVMYQKGWVYNSVTNAEWRVRPLWPLKLPYYILELPDDYSYSVVGTNSLNYLWIMAREPEIESSLLEEIVSRMEARGYKREKIEIMSHKEDDFE